MTDSPRLALGTSSRRPAVWLLNLDTGERVPLRTPLDNGGAFGGGLARRGWVAAKVEYQVGAYLDGADLGSPVLFPPAWTMLPAATDDLVLLLLQRSYGRSGVPGERTRVAVLGPDGAVHRSAELPWGVEAQVVGEISIGVVTWAGIYGWDGHIQQLPVETAGDPHVDPLRPFGVLGGRVIVFEGVDFVESVDVLDGSRQRYPIPATPHPGPFKARFGDLRWYNAAGTWLAMYYSDRRTDLLNQPAKPGEPPWANFRGVPPAPEDYVVAGPGGEIRWLPGRPRAVNLWVGDKLVQWDWKDGRATEYDPVTDRFTPADVAPMTVKPDEFIPKIEVTGRFEWPLRR